MSNKTLFVLPIKFRYLNFEIIDPKETSKIMKDAVPMTLDEAWNFIQDSTFTTEELAIVQLDMNDCRKLNGFYLLRIMLDSVPSTRTFINYFQTLGIRFTPKDRKHGPGRLLRRVETALLKPEIMQLHLKSQQHALMTDAIHKAFKSDATWSTLRDSLEYLMGVQNASDGKDVMAALIYSLVFLMDDDEMIHHWILRMKAMADPKQEILASILGCGLNAYLQTQQRVVQTKATVKPLSPQNEIDRLRQENERLQQQYEYDVRTLLEVIEHLELKHRESHVTVESPSLEGMRILVVGDDSRAMEYRTIIEAYGAKFDFLSGFEKNRSMSSKLSAADGIIFITAYASHVKYYAMKSMDKCSVLVPKAGLRAFSKGLEELSRKLQASNEVLEF